MSIRHDIDGRPVTVQLFGDSLVVDCAMPQHPENGPRVWLERRNDGTPGWKIYVHVDNDDAVLAVDTSDADSSAYTVEVFDK
jgi:hypothetical protein